MDRNPFKGSDQVFGGKENDPETQREQASQDPTPHGAGGENDPGEQAKVTRPDLDTPSDAFPGGHPGSSGGDKADSSKSGQSKKPSKKK